MDIMAEWLSSTIQKDLGQVLERNPEHTEQLGRALYEDDGSNCRVKLSKKGVVQIVKWTDMNETLQVHVSDSVTIMKAIIASGAATRHQEKTGKRVTEDTLGNIIQLQDAEIVATQLGPRSSMITLLIKQLKVLGSDRSGQFGSPRHFDSTPEYAQLLRKISEFRGSFHGPGSSQSTTGTPTRTFASGPVSGSHTIKSEFHPDSQQLMSQVPGSYSANDTASRSNTSKLTGLRLPKDASETSERHESKPHVNQSEALLEMMRSRQALSRAETKLKGPVQVSKAMDSEVRKVQQPRPSLRKGAVDVEQPRGERPNDTHSSAKPQEVSPRKPIQRPVISKKIKSRDVRIPKEQQEILDRNDSWLPAEPGRRGPTTNIPLSVLEEITRKVRHRASQLSLNDDMAASEQKPEGGSSIESELKGNEDSDSDVPVSTADWPPSSPIHVQRCELPPDSSVGAPSPGNSLQEHDRATTESDTRHVEVSQQTAPEPSMGRLVSGASPMQVPATAAHVEISDSESDLETNIPLKLNEGAPSDEEIEYTQEVPATAIQPQESFLQVNRTPYPHWAAAEPHVESPERKIPDHEPSPSKRKRLDQPYTAQANTDSVGVHDAGIDETILPSVKSTQDTAVACQWPTDGSTLERTPQVSEIGSERQANLRRKADSPVVSPFVSAKRRKVHRSPLAFGFSQDEYPKEDPSIAMRRYREEFFASRQNSHSDSRTSPDEAEARAPLTPTYTKAINSTRTATSDVEHLNMLESPSQARQFSAVAHGADRVLEHTVPPNSNDAKSQTSGVAYGHMTGWAHMHNVDKPASNGHSLPTSELGAQRLDVASIDQHEQPSLLLTQSVHTDLNSVSTKLGTHSNAETSQQTHSSGQAQPLPELMTPAMSVSDIPQNSSPHPNLLALPQKPLGTMDIFARFQFAYPEYSGTRDHFHGMCKKIYLLVQAGRMEHKSLWDDFVIRHKTNYPQYLQRCVDSVEDAKPYEQFYHDEVDEPRFTKRVMQPGILSEVIHFDRIQVAAKDHRSPLTSGYDLSPKAQAGAKKSLSLGASNQTHPRKGITGEPTTSNKPSINRSIIEADHQLYTNDSHQTYMAKGKRRFKFESVPESSQTIDLTSDRSSSQLSTPQPRRPPIPSIDRTSRENPRNKPELNAEGSSGGNGSAKRFQASAEAGPSSRSEPPAAQKGAGKHEKEVEASVAKNLKVLAKHSASSRTAKDKQFEHQAEQVDEWWKDEDTPFRQFTKKYKAIKPGRGNSWAQEMKKKGGGSEKVTIKEPEVTRRRILNTGRRVDVMKWYL
ncbi:MAG: hypothetical protein Q9218_001357 [Villophora microphyllina]